MVIELPENKAFLHSFRAGSPRTDLRPCAPDDARSAARERSLRAAGSTKSSPPPSTKLARRRFRSAMLEATLGASAGGGRPRGLWPIHARAEVAGMNASGLASIGCQGPGGRWAPRPGSPKPAARAVRAGASLLACPSGTP